MQAQPTAVRVSSRQAAAARFMFLHRVSQPLAWRGAGSPSTVVPRNVGATTRPRYRVHVAQADAPQVAAAEEAPILSVPNAAGHEGAFATPIDMWPWLAEAHSEQVAVQEPHNAEAVPLTYGQLWEQMQRVAAGLASLAVAPSTRVGVIAENSSRWIIADQGAMLAGAATAVRGSSAPADEVAYILGHAACTGLIIQDAAALRALAPRLQSPVEGEPRVDLKFVVLLWGAAPTEDLVPGVPVLTWTQLLERGAANLAALSTVPRPSPSDLATLVYTSGTTGHPKGVMLTHSNLAYQINNLAYFVPIRPGDSVLSLLPPWHIYARTCALYIHSCAGRIVFTSVRRAKDDLAAYPPDHLVAVPLLLDTLHARIMARLTSAPEPRRTIARVLLAASTIYVRARRVAAGLAIQHALKAPNDVQYLAATLLTAMLAPIHALAHKLVYGKIREALGVRRTVISGGGSLAAHLDDFFEVIGLTVVNGWGLSETSPVLACRRVATNVRGTVGPPAPGTQLRVVDPEDVRVNLPEGTPGLLLARGPGIMAGYLNDPGASAAAFRAGDGWFDTGDLGWIVPATAEAGEMAGMVVLSGRAKDTIVLVSGKNVEPQPIEDAVCASPLVKHAMVLGQDKRELGLLVFPDTDALPAGVTDQAQLQALITPEVTRLNAARHDYSPEQHISHVYVVMRGSGLSPDDGTLTRTMKLRRPAVTAAYAPEVAALTAVLRG